MIAINIELERSAKYVKLMESRSQHNQLVVEYSVALSLVEVGLGSLLHSFKVPFAGHFLSLNQGAFLTRATLQSQNARSSLWISNIVAILKSLAPAGKKLTPMLAISAQGLLYFLGVAIFGVGFVGQIIGMVLLSLWAFLQPLMIYYFLFGQQLIEVAEYFLKQLEPVVPITLEHLGWALVALAIIKVIIGVFVVRAIHKMSETEFDRFISRFSVFQKNRRDVGDERLVSAHLTKSSKLRSVAKELFKPTFIVSFLLTGSFLLITQPFGVDLMWNLMRPLALGVLLFGLIKFVPFERILAAEAKDGSFQQALAESLKKLKERV